MPFGRTRVLISLLFVAFLVIGTVFALRSTRERAHPLRFGAIAFPGYEWFFLAEKLGYYEPGSIQLVDFSSSTESLRAYQNHAIDAVALTLDEALRLSEHDQHRIILVTDVSDGADVVIGRPGLSQVADLRGKRVGVELNALGTFVLARTLAKSNLSTKDLTVVPSAIYEHVALYDRGELDAVVTFEPNRTRLLQRGGRILFDSHQLPNEIVDVVVVRQSALRDNEPALKQLLTAWFKARRYAERHPGDAAKLVCKREAVSAADFEASLSGLRIPDLQENRVLLNARSSPLLATFAALNDTMVAAGIFDKPVPGEGLLFDGLLGELGEP